MTEEQDRFRAVMSLVDEALDLPAAERDAVLASGSDDARVREEARRLLDADRRADAFLSEPAARGAPSAIAELVGAASRTLAGTRVGPFRLVSLLGRGGMGEVWVAERSSDDFEQRVALKLLPVAEDDATAARFRRERQILARLSHPHIAKLFDGGVTPEGRAWLAMELVPGVSLTEHVAREHLNVDARLRLFVEICEAVQFAHQNLVVHRDLKPSNVMVTDAGEPKLLDFGIAKILESDNHDLTRTNERPMTLDYAAPEQIRGDAVTTASDVWSLGVILHELLTGVRPYRATAKNRLDVERAILAAEPSRPSSSIDGGDTKLKRRLRGDLDAIVLKAMRGDPKDRYPSVETLAADVRRHLDHAPVAARGGATSYLVRAMVRRHRVAFVVSALVVASLLGGMASTLWQARRAREETRKAEEAERFLISMLRAFDPHESGGKAITQRDILERGEARVDELGAEPEVQARLLEAFAETWYGMAAPDRAQKPTERALAIERRTLGARSIEVAKTLILLGDIQFDKGDFTDSVTTFDEALSIARDVEGPNGLTVASALNELAGSKRRLVDYAEAETLRRQSLAIYETRLGPDNATTLGVMNDLAVLLGDEGRFAESLNLQQRTCELMVRVIGAANPSTLSCQTNLARNLIELDRAREADAILSDVYDLQVKVLGEDWADVALTLQWRGAALDELGHAGEALALFDDAVARETRYAGADHPQTAAILARESSAFRHLGRFTEAEETARRALEICRSRLGADHANTARARLALGSALLDEGRAKEGQVEIRSALEAFEKKLGPSHADSKRARSELERADAVAN